MAPNLRKVAGTDISNIRSGVIAESIKAGDQIVEEIVRVAAEHIGTAVAAVVHLLSPDVVVLGGGLVEAMPDLFVEAVSKAAKIRVLPSFAKSYRVVAAKLGDDASVMGAAAWAKRRLSKLPTGRT
jgi:glucokinase